MRENFAGMSEWCIVLCLYQVLLFTIYRSLRKIQCGSPIRVVKMSPAKCLISLKYPCIRLFISSSLHKYTQVGTWFSLAILIHCWLCFILTIRYFNDKACVMSRLFISIIILFLGWWLFKYWITCVKHVHITANGVTTLAWYRPQ